MSLRQDLINNICEAINSEMNDTERLYNIYAEDNLCEPSKPYFSIRDISPNAKPLLNDSRKYSELIVVEYHPGEVNTERLASIYNVSEHLFECLGVVNGTRANSTEARVVDGVLIFTVSYQFKANVLNTFDTVKNYEITTIAE